jgi:hypothetical protein
MLAYVTEKRKGNMINWQPLTDNFGSGTKEFTFFFFRAKILGGWLVMMMASGANPSVTFVPDPTHQWDGKSLP